VNLEVPLDFNNLKEETGGFLLFDDKTS
jgi:hypothetical protein